jgi:hypothetical protein
MEKRWLLRLPKDLDDWLTLKAAEETVMRGKRVSKNTLVIELATNVMDGRVLEPAAETGEVARWHDVKSALEYIQEAVQQQTELPAAVADRLKQRVSVNLKILESYLEELEQ